MPTGFSTPDCDDATISFQKGHIIVEFARDSESIEVAISSAVACVRNAGAHVDRLEPDPLVSLSDIAARTGMSRAAITQYAKGQRSEDFPAPVAEVTSDTSLYDWSQVATCQRKKLSHEQAIEAEAVNIVNESIRAGDAKLSETLHGRLQEYEAELETRLSAVDQLLLRQCEEGFADCVRGRDERLHLRTRS